MTTSARELKLGMFLFANGHHQAAWRLPESPLVGPYDFAQLHRTAQALEKAKFVFLFFGDTYFTSVKSTASTIARPEPFTMASNVAAVTKKIGLIATANTNFNEPFNVARKAASLDHLSGGRAALNIVTGFEPLATANFGITEPSNPVARWRRASEFVDVARSLWDSFEDDALIRDQQTGHFVDESKFHLTNFKGEYFSVRGPLNSARPPQGYPVLFQAGTTDDAYEFAAKYTDVFFIGAGDITEALEISSNLRARLPRHGRDPGAVKIMPAVAPYVAETKAKAQEIFDRLNGYLDENLDVARLSALLELDLSAFPLDGPLPEIADAVARKRMAGHLLRRAKAEKLSIRQVAQAHQASVFGHLLLVGSVKDIADTFESWFRAGACDGFNVCPPFLPGSLDLFLEGVVPELQRRGVYKKDYRGSTLREYLGIERPENQFAARRRAAEAASSSSELANA